jgi:hypothetical protein
MQERLLNHIPIIYEDILDFSYSVKTYIGDKVTVFGRLKRMGKSIVSDPTLKFGDKIGGIKAHAEK